MMPKSPQSLTKTNVICTLVLRGIIPEEPGLATGIPATTKGAYTIASGHSETE